MPRGTLLLPLASPNKTTAPGGKSKEVLSLSEPQLVESWTLYSCWMVAPPTPLVPDWRAPKSGPVPRDLATSPQLQLTLPPWAEASGRLAAKRTRRQQSSWPAIKRQFSRKKGEPLEKQANLLSSLTGEGRIWLPKASFRASLPTPWHLFVESENPDKELHPLWETEK